MLKYKYHVFLYYCLIFLLCLIEANELKGTEGNSSKPVPKKTAPPLIERVRPLLDGFNVGEGAKLFPYASINEWFDPYIALKLGHRAFWHKKDQMFHHFKVESYRDFSWKFRYLANSLSSKNTKFSFLFKIKLDRDAYYYGVGNNTIKDERQLATYSSMVIGAEITQSLFNKIAFRWTPGFWMFKTGLIAGGDFETAAEAQYITSRITLSDLKSIDYWKTNLDNQWSFYIEMGLPVNSILTSYARMNFQTITRFPVFASTKFCFGTRIEYLISPERALVPYFALPEIGSGSGLRGFSKERFRNFGVTGINLEYSLQLSKEFEAFLLTDLANSFRTFHNLATGDIHTNYGIGIRFLNNNPISAGITHGDEGWKLFSTIATGLPW